MKLILIGILLHAGFADDTLCKSGQTWYGGACYEELDNTMTWGEANEACAVRGGELVVPNSRSENEYILEMLRKSGVINGNVWLGCTRDQQNKEMWLHGEEECTYFKWDTNEPNNPYLENCAEMRAEYNSKWNDVSCSNQNSVICEHSAIQPDTQVNMTCLVADYNGRFAATK